MSQFINMLTNSLTTTPQIQSPEYIRTSGSSNPFASGNPFVSSATNPFANYGKNKPVSGGYFAGYYHNQPNIVGRRLFIEV